MLRRYLDASLIVVLAASPVWSSTAARAADTQQDLPYVPKWSVPVNGKVSTKAKTVPAASKQAVPAATTAPASNLVDSAQPASSDTTPPPKPIRLRLTDPAALYADDSPQTVPKAPTPRAQTESVYLPMPPLPDPAEAKVILQPHSVLALPNVPAVRPRSSASSRLLAAPAVISGQNSRANSSTVTKLVNNVVDEHFSKDAQAQKLDQQVKRLHAKTQNTTAKGKDSHEDVGSSKHKGMLAWLDKPKVQDATVAEYELQKYADKIHSQVISSMMEIAMGLGIPEANRREEVVGSGLHSLDTLVGQEQSKAAYEALKSWISKHGVPEKVFKIPIWDTGEREKKLDIVLQSAAQRDSVVTQLKTKEDANVEERIQSRMQVLNQEAGLAIDNYRFAMVTHNSPLLAFSQALVVEMSSKDVAGKVFAAPVFDAPPLVPEDKPAKHKGDGDDDDA